jgi:LPXTG-motif cell wall-anchored protein
MNEPRMIGNLRLTMAGAILSSWYLLGVVAHAQDTTTSMTSTGKATVTTEVKSATVVYVSGNDLVVKADDGTVKHFVVPDDRKITVDGKELTVRDLQPGMRLTRTITTTTVPQTVQTVRTIQGKVWYVNPPHGLILSLPEGNKSYKVPDGAMFDVNGKKQSIFHVKKGMVISATIITDTPQTVVNSTRTVADVAPPPAPAPPTPPIVGVLLIERAPAPAPAPQPEEVAQASLPKTGSSLPLIGLLGLLSLAFAAGMRKLRA